MATGDCVQILMSSYNGERYLRQQLDSYAAQTAFDRIRVLIRDDGSTDGTRAILEEYREKYGFSVVYGENVGVNASYQWLLDHADLECAWFAFSDQDDVWLPHKIRRALEVLSAEDGTKPLLYASRSMVTDAGLQPIGLSQSAPRGAGFYNAMLQNVCPGHTQVFNRAVLRLLRSNPADRSVVIDWWVYLLAAGLGKVCLDDDYTVLHRQHGDNAVGYGTTFWALLGPRLRRLLRGDSYKMAVQLQRYDRDFGPLLPADHRAELTAFLEHQRGLANRLAYVAHCRAYRQNKWETLAFKAYYLLGKYDLEKVMSA